MRLILELTDIGLDSLSWKCGLCTTPIFFYPKTALHVPRKFQNKKGDMFPFLPLPLLSKTHAQVLEFLPTLSTADPNLPTGTEAARSTNWASDLDF